MRPGPFQASQRRRDQRASRESGGPAKAGFEACPKCHGQYRRDGRVYHCYQCCFEWDQREPVESVLARARRKHWGERPRDSIWADGQAPADDGDRLGSG